MECQDSHHGWDRPCRRKSSFLALSIMPSSLFSSGSSFASHHLIITSLYNQGASLNLSLVLLWSSLLLWLLLLQWWGGYFWSHFYVLINALDFPELFAEWGPYSLFFSFRVISEENFKKKKKRIKKNNNWKASYRPVLVSDLLPWVGDPGIPYIHMSFSHETTHVNCITVVLYHFNYNAGFDCVDHIEVYGDL